jgi:hypothetical protein
VIAVAGFLGGALLDGRLALQLAARPAGGWSSLRRPGRPAGHRPGLGTGAFAYQGRIALVTTGLRAVGFGLQKATVRRLAAPDLTTSARSPELFCSARPDGGAGSLHGVDT